MTNETNTAKSQARAQYESISEMIERLQHAESCNGEFTADDCEFYARFDNADEWETYHDADAAREAIDDDPLSVEVRSGWESPGTDLTPSEFCILLCTGGPAVRILGELDLLGQPDRAWLEYQDWGTQWTQYFEAEQDTILSYAQNFYFDC